MLVSYLTIAEPEKNVINIFYIGLFLNSVSVYIRNYNSENYDLFPGNSSKHRGLFFYMKMYPA